MRVAFENAAIHERAGVAFVRVADDEFSFARRVVPRLPLHAGRESRAAASAHAGAFDFVNHFLRVFFVERFGRGKVPVPADVSVQTVVFDYAAVAQCDSNLFFEEVDVVDLGDMLFQGEIVERVLRQDFAVQDMLVDHPPRDLRRQFGIKNAFGQNQHHGSRRAGADAAGLAQKNLVFHADLFQFVGNGVSHIGAVGGNAARAAADQHLERMRRRVFVVSGFNLLEIR